MRVTILRISELLLQINIFIKIYQINIFVAVITPDFML